MSSVIVCVTRARQLIHSRHTSQFRIPIISVEELETQSHQCLAVGLCRIGLVLQLCRDERDARCCLEAGHGASLEGTRVFPRAVCLEARIDACTEKK